MMKIILSIIGLGYVLCPYDIFPDVFVGIGWIDDLVVLGLLWKFFYLHKKKQFVRENREKYQFFGKENNTGFNGNNTGTQSQFNNKTKNPYTILGINETASITEIKLAYRQLANKYHPDKVTHLGEEFKKLAEERFKEIQEAYRELLIDRK